MSGEIIAFNQAALLLKTEGASYGVDSTPAGSTDAMLIQNGRIRFASNKLSREISTAYFGSKPFVLTGRQTIIEFDFEIMGNATVDLAAPIAPILLASAHAQTLNAATDARYNPITLAIPSMTAYFYIPSSDSNGAKRFVALGVEIDCTFNHSVNAFAKGHAVMTGLEADVTNTAIPSLTLTGFRAPFEINASTWQVTVDDGSSPFDVSCVEVSLAQNGKVQLFEHSEEKRIAIVGREASGFLRIFDPALADIDFYALAAALTPVEISSIVDGGATLKQSLIIQAQLEEPEPIDINGASGLRIPFVAVPTTAGNDEYEWVFE